MSALKGRIPRGYVDHRTRAGRTYTRHVRAILGRLGMLPDDAAPTLREVGRLAVLLEQLGLDEQTARNRRRLREASRLRRHMLPLRTQLVTLERRLEELAKTSPRTSVLAALLAEETE